MKCPDTKITMDLASRNCESNKWVRAVDGRHREFLKKKVQKTGTSETDLERIVLLRHVDLLGCVAQFT